MNAIGLQFKRHSAVSFVLVGLVMISVAVAVALFQYWTLAAQVSAQSLDTTQAVQKYIQEQRNQHLAQVSKSIASNPGFISYIAQALTPDAATGAKMDVSSMRDLLEERRTEFGFDVAAIVQPDGLVVAGTGGSRLPIQNLSTNPIFVEARRYLTAASHIWNLDERVLLVTLTPVLRGASLEAFLLTGISLDETYVKKIAQVSHADVAIVAATASGPAVLASSLDARSVEQLRAALSARPDRLGNEGIVAADTFELDLGGQHWPARLVPVADTEGHLLVLSLMAPASRDPLARAIAQPFLTGLATALVLALAFALILWRSFVRPLATLSNGCERALAGDYALAIPSSGGRVVMHLNQTFNHLLAVLDRTRAKPGMPSRRGTDGK